MPCFSPLSARRLRDGRIVFYDAPDAVGFLSLPCGQCIGCRLERSRQWAVRCVHEASMHEFNSFITLTYSPDNIPQFGSLDYNHFQLFMKRLRKQFKVPIRFFMCGEYGDNFARPHYHACLFGIDFPDKKVHARSKSGSLVYHSESLQRLWPYGFAYTGDVTFESAAYVARYVMKKVTGDAADNHYSVVNEYTGEIMGSRVPEFCRMSLKPGIGRPWLDKYYSDVYPHNRVVIRGAKSNPPRYYSKVMRKRDFVLFEHIQNKNLLAMRKNISDNTRARLRVKSHVTEALLDLLKRDSF